MSQPADAVDSGARLTPQGVLDAAPQLSRRQRSVVFVAFCAMVFEGVEVTVASFIFPEIVRDWNVTIDQITFTVTAGVVGMAVGGAVAGWTADRFGRRVTAASGIALFGTVTAAMAVTSSFEAFAALRIVACFGLGAAVPVVITLVADSMPSHRRAQMVALTFSGLAAGTAISGSLASAIIPTLGWPALLVIASIGPIAFAPVIGLALPEPPASLMARREEEGKIRRSLELLAPDCDLSKVDYSESTPTDRDRRKSPFEGVLSRGMVGTTLLLWLMFFIGLGSAFLLANYLPLMTRSEGFTAAQAGVMVAVFGWGTFVGQVSISFALKRFDRFKVLALLWLLGLAGVISIAAFTLGYAGYLVVAAGLGLTVASGNAALNALSTLAYPPAVRATGVGWANALGRVGTLVSGLVGGAMLAAGWSIGHILMSLSVPLAAGVLALIALRSLTVRRRIPVTPSQPAKTIQDANDPLPVSE